VHAVRWSDCGLHASLPQSQAVHAAEQAAMQGELAEAKKQLQEALARWVHFEGRVFFRVQLTHWLSSLCLPFPRAESKACRRKTPGSVRS
jgi:hypothetical protein